MTTPNTALTTTGKQNRKHSDNSPSSIFRRLLCPPSYFMELGLPQPEPTEEGMRGENCHDLTIRFISAIDEAARATILATLPYQLSELDIAFCQWAADRALELIWPGAGTVFEEYVDLRWFHPSIGGGYFDMAVIEDFLRALVIDFKFGFNRVEPAATNLQLACYAEGVRMAFDVPKVEVCIIQPAFGLVDLAKVEVETIEKARDAVSRSLNPDNRRPIPGAAQCAYCKAAGKCPAQVAMVQAAPKLPAITCEEDWKKVNPATVSAIVAEYEDRNVEKIIGWGKKWLLSLMIAGGYEDAHYKLGQKRAFRKFVDNAEPRLRDLCEKRGIDPSKLFTEPELKSPAGVESLVGKSKDVRAALEPLVLKIPGGPTIERKGKSPEQLESPAGA